MSTERHHVEQLDQFIIDRRIRAGWDEDDAADQDGYPFTEDEQRAAMQWLAELGAD